MRAAGFVPAVLLASLLGASSAGAQPASAGRYMVAAAHPLAVEAGLRMLERGGSAVDAMVATQLVLNLVEPQSSGLGGSAYLLHYDGRRKQLSAIDARETAPFDVSPHLFLKPDGKPMGFEEAAVGGRAVGVPGVPRLLEVAHARHGRLPWRVLFQPAIEIAEKGFALSPRLHRQLGEDKYLATQPAARAYFLDAEARPKAVGTVLRNPQFAATLEAIAARGADAFYQGDIARDIVETVRSHPTNPGVMTLDDLARYRVRDIDPVCIDYRAWRVCSVGPSSYGGIAVLQILGMLARFDLAGLRPGSSQSVHLLAEAGRLAYSDRARYGADARFVDVPVGGLLEPSYLEARAALIAPQRSMGPAQAGRPRGAAAALADDPHGELVGTSHVSIVDGQGNAVALTTSIEWFFGSRQMVRGFLLNNQLTDFSFTPVDNGRLAANAAAGGKRPRSSMAPVIVFERASGRVEMVLGSAGGSYIINYVAKALVASLDWKLDPQSAVGLANFGSRNGPTELERGTELARLEPALKAMGHDVRITDMTSGTHVIRRGRNGWLGAADPRREGVARGR